MVAESRNHFVPGRMATTAYIQIGELDFTKYYTVTVENEKTAEKITVRGVSGAQLTGGLTVEYMPPEPEDEQEETRTT